MLSPFFFWAVISPLFRIPGTRVNCDSSNETFLFSVVLTNTFLVTALPHILFSSFMCPHPLCSEYMSFGFTSHFFFRALNTFSRPTTHNHHPRHWQRQKNGNPNLLVLEMVRRSIKALIWQVPNLIPSLDIGRGRRMEMPIFWFWQRTRISNQDLV